MTASVVFRPVRAALVALACVLALVLCFAAPASAAPPATRRIAVVVGANDPPPGRPPLRFAHDDATDLADVLRRVGGFAPDDVRVMLDPHPRDLLAELDRVAGTARSTGGDVLFVFYYSGHSDGQSLFPHGEPIALADVRSRVEKLGARIRVGILDTCRGGSWTQSKGLTVGPPLGMADLLNVGTEGTALVSSSSGLENAHEAADVHGSFFTHYFTAGLRGAADRAGDGNVTLEEAFDYAKERTVRDSARLAKTPQHPSFDLALRGRQDIVLTVLSSSTSALEVTDAKAPVEVIHLPSGVTVADAPAGKVPVRIAVPPGRYLVRSVVDGHVYAKEIEVKSGETATLSDGQLEATGNQALAMKGQGDDDEDDDDATGEDESPKPSKDKKSREDDKWRFPLCNDTDEDKTVRASKGCEGVFGVRGSVSDAIGPFATQRTGFEVSADSEEYWRHDKVFSGVWRYRAAIGGGGAGLEGTLLGDVAFGFRLPVAEDQGPVLRAGMKGWMIGNDVFYSSLLELPQLQVGWQWSQGHAVAEIGATGGMALTGRFRSWEEPSRGLGTAFAYGGRASLQIPWVRLSASVERLPPGDSLDSVDVGMTTLCIVASPLAICGDALVEQGHFASAGSEAFVRSVYGGLTLGFTGEH
jgi:hypothetical protein